MIWNVDEAVMERIDENARYIIYRAVHEATGEHRILKQLKDELSDADMAD